MNHIEKDNETIDQLIRWGEQQPLVRAMLITGSRANPQAPKDVFSDFDVILVLHDIQQFYEDRAWLKAFGPVLALYRDPLIPEDDLVRSGYVVQYENGLKIDFSLWPVELLQRETAASRLSDEFDAGYQILLDKDHLTDELKTPTHRGYIPSQPTEIEYQETVEGFLLDSTYVAKLLWRDDMMAAKYILDYALKQDQLRRMLEWHIEINHNWSVKPGPYGRWLKRWLQPDLWIELEGTYTGADPEANWGALFRTLALFRRVAIEVGEHFGYTYPQDLERRTIAYLQRVQQLERNAERFVED